MQAQPGTITAADLANTSNSNLTSKLHFYSILKSIFSIKTLCSFGFAICSIMQLILLVEQASVAVQLL